MNFCAIIVIVACITVAEPIEASKPDWQTFEATAYTANCAGCTGITKTGIDVRKTIYHEGKRIIAVDPRVIPLGSTVEVRLPDGMTFEALAEDVGGAIKGARIDLLVADKKIARAFGRQDVELRIISREGEEMKDQTEIIANLASRLYEAERRISELETKVGVHIRRIQALERSANNSVLTSGLVDYRIISRAPQAVRDEIVERAKRDIAMLETSYQSGIDGNVSFWPKGCEKDGYAPCHYVEYVVNRDKRTVVALIRVLPELDERRPVYYHGKAKCAPGDCFNVHIGKAIALRRALGLPVPGEYLNAPQPTEVRAGDIVRLCDGRLYKCKYNWPKLTAGETFFDDTRDGYEYKTEVTAE